ncbi:FMN-binding protein [bacterium]|nr:FMN-binding protein [bacterium]
MKKKDIIVGIIVLLSITVLSGFLLAQVFNIAEPKISEQKKIDEETLNREIFQDGVTFEQKKIKDIKFTVVHNKDGDLLGRIFDLKATGYGGQILIKAGVDKDLKITGIRILEHTETPGLGSKITDAGFLEQFKDKEDGTIYLKKDNPQGEIDSITGATVSSSAVTEEIRKLQENLKTLNGETQ